MANRSLDSSQLELIAKQAQLSIELIEIDWKTDTGIDAQGQVDGYLTVRPGAATTFYYADTPVWADRTHGGQINVISTPSGVETIDYVRRISMKWDNGWKAAIGRVFNLGFVEVSSVDPTLTALEVDDKFYINLHYNEKQFYLFDSSYNLITSDSVLSHDYGIDYCFNNGLYPIDFGGKTYLPLATFLTVSEIEEAADFQISSMTIAINGIDYVHNQDDGFYAFDYYNYDAEYQSYEGDPNSKFSVVKVNNPVWRFLVDNYVSHNVRVYRAFLDHNMAVIGDPLLIFDGFMNKPAITIDPGGQTMVSIECTNHWSDFEKRNGRHTNYKEQLAWANSNYGAVDKVFEYTYQKMKQIKWGAASTVVNPPSALRYTKSGNVYTFLWNSPTTVPDSYEIQWTVPVNGTTVNYAVPGTTTKWISPNTGGLSYDIKIYAIKDGVRSKAATTGTTAYDITNSGGTGGFYGDNFDNVILP